MRKISLRLLLAILISFLPKTTYSQVKKLQPGFKKAEYLELLRISSHHKDSANNPDLEPRKFKKVYSSPSMALDNKWFLWVSDDSLACISIRGATDKQESWIENFYAAMLPAKGKIKISNDFIFDYNLSDNPRSAVHTGWLIATAFLSQDILPKIDSIYQLGVKNIYLSGHSQGGAIAYLLTAYIRKKQQANELPNDVTFKTYCGAAPKPGNLYFAYDYETLTKGGWSYTVINPLDWVPQTPFSIQTIPNFNKLNPFTDAKTENKKAPFFKRQAINYIFNQLDKPTRKACKQHQKYLGVKVERFVKNVLPEFEPPVYFNSNNYVRTGQQIILHPDDEYYKRFPQDKNKIWTNHKFESYIYLMEYY